MKSLCKTASLLFLLLSSCSWGLIEMGTQPDALNDLTHEEEEQDISAEADIHFDDGSTEEPAGEEPDVFIDLPPDPVGEDVVIDPEEDESPGPDIPSECGNGIVEGPEQCDDVSAFCSPTCMLQAPADGWIECSDSDGNRAFLIIENPSGDHTYSQMRDYCRSMIEGYSPENYSFYGLAVFYDENIWNCIVSNLDSGSDYYIGMYQDTTAPDFHENDGGWYWTAYNGSEWINLESFNPSNGFLISHFDNEGGGTPSDCGRLSYSSGWYFMDNACSYSADWYGICMIRF